MIGTRPFTQNEIEVLIQDLPTLRDKTLFILGIYTGFRIQECLSLKVKDIQNDRITVKRSEMKGKISSRSVTTHPILKQYLNALIARMRSFPEFNDSWYVFHPKNTPNKPLSRVMAWKILNKSITKLGIKGNTGLHSTRKTFADRVYSALNHDLLKTSRALGHKNISSTVNYLSFRTEEIDKAINTMDFPAQTCLGKDFK